jgi:hypothetical protein
VTPFLLGAVAMWFAIGLYCALACIVQVVDMCRANSERVHVFVLAHLTLCIFVAWPLFLSVANPGQIEP